MPRVHPESVPGLRFKARSRIRPARHPIVYCIVTSLATSPSKRDHDEIARDSAVAIDFRAGRVIVTGLFGMRGNQPGRVGRPDKRRGSIRRVHDPVTKSLFANSPLTSAKASPNRKGSNRGLALFRPKSPLGPETARRDGRLALLRFKKKCARAGPFRAQPAKRTGSQCAQAGLSRAHFPSRPSPSGAAPAIHSRQYARTGTGNVRSDQSRPRQSGK